MPFHLQLCRHFVEGTCSFGEHCRYSHSHGNDTTANATTSATTAGDGNNNNNSRKNSPRPQQRQPRDYQSVQTQMEIISNGVDAIIDIQKLIDHGNESLVEHLFKLPPHLSSSTKQVQQQQGSPSVLVALDFHGVTDVVTSLEEQITPQSVAPICVVSYVGPFGEIRDRTRESLTSRVESGQITMGVMVFKKLRDPNERDIPPVEFVASKRHAVELLLKSNNNINRVLFVDDSKDNVATVASLQLESVKCVVFKGKDGDELRNFLKEQMK